MPERRVSSSRRRQRRRWAGSSGSASVPSPCHSPSNGPRVCAGAGVASRRAVSAIRIIAGSIG
ncbi:MAG: 50S ribosomal protein L32 [Proteobacteria bacterium]|nr:50S ribosomal protein L32 [Pseudomonadota bacterium]